MVRTFFAALILFPVALVAGQSLPVHITARELEVRREQGVILFSGQVSTVQGDFYLTCDELEALMSGTGNDVTELQASGNVRFVQGDRHGTAQTAHYSVAVSELVLTGKPVVFDGPNRLAGKRIRYSTADGRLRVHQADSTLYRNALTGITGSAKPK